MFTLVNIAELATCPAGNPQNDAGIVRNAALATDGETIAWSGPMGEIPDKYQGGQTIDCGGRLVVPGLIDCHTHLCFGGGRGDEF